MSHDPNDCYDWDYEEVVECANCGGEGFVSHCFEEWACMHPDEGCDMCMRRCDWCNPAPKPADGANDLRQVLADALAEGSKP